MKSVTPVPISLSAAFVPAQLTAIVLHFTKAASAGVAKMLAASALAARTTTSSILGFSIVAMILCIIKDRSLAALGEAPAELEDPLPELLALLVVHELVPQTLLEHAEIAGDFLALW